MSGDFPSQGRGRCSRSASRARILPAGAALGLGAWPRAVLVVHAIGSASSAMSLSTLDAVLADPVFASVAFHRADAEALTDADWAQLGRRPGEVAGRGGAFWIAHGAVVFERPRCMPGEATMLAAATRRLVGASP